MKYIRALLLTTLLFLIGGMESFANPVTYYGMNLTASLSTQVSSGSTSSITTVPVNNHTITQAIFSTGTSGALKASDLAIALGNANLNVINTSGSSVVVVTTLASTGTNSATQAIEGRAKSNVSVIGEISDYEFTLPGVANVQVTNSRIMLKVNLVTNAISHLFFSFAGGHGNGPAGSTFFQGTLKQNGKVYH